MTTPVVPTPITAAPPVPNSNDPEATFDAQFEASLAWQAGDLRTGANALAAATYTNAVASLEAATAAGDAAAAAVPAAGTATTKATEASDSAALAAARLADMVALYDQFDDRYLGVKASDPTLDNDGNALVAGAIYVNSTSGFLRAYNGSAWVQGISALAGVESINSLQGPLTLKTVGGVSLLGGGDVAVPTDVVGQIKTSYTSPGAGWLECNGAVYLQSSYTSLYAALGLLTNMSGYRNQGSLVYVWNGTALAGAAEYVTNVVNTGTALVFIATRTTATAAAVCLRSTDGGATWSQASIAAAIGLRLSKLAYGNGRLIAASGYGGQADYLTSDDHGVTWTSRSFGAAYTTYDVVYGGGKWVHNGTRYSTDGTTWTLGPAPVSMYQLAHNGTTWVGIQGGVYTSPDGINWTAVSGITIDPAGYDYHRKCLIHANGAFWIAANVRTAGAASGESAKSWQLLRSTDGQNWTAVAAPMRYTNYSSQELVGSVFDVSNGEPHLFAGLGMIGVSIGGSNGKVASYVTKDMVTWEVLHKDYDAEYSTNSNILPAPFAASDRFAIVQWRTSGTIPYVFRESAARITYSTSTQFAVPHIVPSADGRKAYIKAA